MKLLGLPDGNLSLELQAGELASLLRDLLRRPDATLEHLATADVLHVAGTRIVVMDEWEEPCLISVDQPGSTLLREIAEGRSRRAAVA